MQIENVVSAVCNKEEASVMRSRLQYEFEVK